MAAGKARRKAKAEEKEAAKRAAEEDAAQATAPEAPASARHRHRGLPRTLRPLLQVRRSLSLQRA